MLKQLKIRHIRKEIEFSEGNCPYCKYLLRAHTDKQLLHNYKLHLKSCEKK